MLKSFKPPGWGSGVFARKKLRCPTKNVYLFATQTVLTMKESSGWHSASITKARVYTLTFMDYHLSSKNSAHFLKVMFALTMMFNCKDLFHWPVDIIMYYLPSASLLVCSMEITFNRMEKYSNEIQTQIPEIFRNTFIRQSDTDVKRCLII